jgi:RNA recognition motif-containing protein
VVWRRLVLFAEREGADRAVRELNGTEMDGRKIFLRKVWVSFVEDLTFAPLSLFS